MPMRRHLTVEEASRAIGFLQTGHSQRQVGAQFNVSHTVIVQHQEFGFLHRQLETDFMHLVCMLENLLYDLH
jgi:hypothetical protein